MAETGHAKNVENWQKMIAACTGFGGDYKPSSANRCLRCITRTNQFRLRANDRTSPGIFLT